jgi:hypothetical protein
MKTSRVTRHTSASVTGLCVYRFQSFDCFDRAFGCIAMGGATRIVYEYERSRKGRTCGEVVKCGDIFGATVLVVPRQKIESTTYT